MSDLTGLDHPCIAETNRAHRLLPVLLIFTGLAAYHNTLPNDFIFDDHPHILLDESIRDLSDWRSVLGRTQRPVIKLTLAINYAMDRLEPRGYHLCNLLIHVGSALLLYGVVRRTLLQPILGRRFVSSAPWLALSVAMLWQLHPLNTQSVTYLIQRGESLMGFFFLLTLYSAIRYGMFGSMAWAIMGIAACLLGVGCKPVMVSAPLVVVLWDYTFVRDFSNCWRRRLLFYLALFATWLPLSWLLAISMSGPKPAFGFGLEVITWWQYALTQPLVVLKYLRLAIFPHPLILDYMHPSLHGLYKINPLLATLKIVVPLGIVLSLVLWTVRGLWCRRPWAFLGACFFLILAPTSSIAPIADIMVEHRMYLPLIVVVAVVVMAMYLVTEKFSGSVRPIYGAVLVVVAAVVLGVTTYRRNLVYLNPISIWDSVVYHRPTNPRAWHNLGSALESAGRFDEALQHYEWAIRLVPSYDEAHNGLGSIYLEKGRVQSHPEARTRMLAMAIEKFEIALQLAPQDPQYHQNLGQAMLLVGDLDKADQLLNRAIDLRPGYGKAHGHLGLVALAREQSDRAIEQFQMAIRFDPELVDPYHNLALQLTRIGQSAEAIKVYREGLKIDPKRSAMLIQLARILASDPEPSIRNGAEAVLLAKQVLDLTDDRRWLSLDTLAAAYAEASQFEKAVQVATVALKAARIAGLPADAINQIKQRLELYQTARPYRKVVD